MLDFPQVGVRVQRFGLPTTPVERNQQLAREPLTKRVFADELRQFTTKRGVLAAGELGFDLVFKRGQPEFGEVGDLGLSERLEGEVGQRISTPQRQCGTEPPRPARC